jgi:hypothetical protein
MEASMFFFEKKNQKTFIRSARRAFTLAMDESLFASFSTEKEDTSFQS